MNLKEMRERYHAGIPKEAEAIKKTAAAEGRELTTEEVEKLEALEAEQADLAVKIEEAARRERVAGHNFSPPRQAEPAPAQPSTRNPWEGAAELPDDTRFEDPADSPYRSFGQQLVDVAMMTDFGNSQPRQRVQASERLAHVMAAASGQSQTVPSEGGFAVVPSYSRMIWEGVFGSPESLIGMTDQNPVDGDSLTLKAADDTDRSAGLIGGAVKSYWLAEAGQMTGSKFKLRDLKLEPKELATFVYVTEKLLRNAPAVENRVVTDGRRAINFRVGDAIVAGDGSGKPLGLMNSGCKIAVAKESGQAGGTVVAENISNMWARMPASLKAESVWLYNIEIEPELDKLSFAIGTSGQLVYLPADGLRGRPMPMLKGRPMIPCEYCEGLGTEGDLILTNLMAYATGLQGTIREAVSMHVRFEYAEMAFRFMFSIDGQSWLHKSITPYKGTNKLSPIVTLATRS